MILEKMTKDAVPELCGAALFVTKMKCFSCSGHDRMDLNPWGRRIGGNMDLMSWVWLVAAVLFGIVEALTAGLVSIWFVAGAAAALIGALLGAGTPIQAALFLAVSAAALAATRPLVRRFAKDGTVATNADRVLGQTGKVTEDIDNVSSTGAVYVDGKTWTARSADGSVIPAGAAVQVLRMEGVKLFVEKIEEKAEVAL